MNQQHIDIPTIRRKPSKRQIQTALRSESAIDALGTILPGCEIFGFTKGQFSLIDLISALLDQTGPAHIVIATWTAARADTKKAHNMLHDERALSIRFMVDYSFQSRQPKFCAQLIDLFGEDAIRVTGTYAKFVVIHNDQWHLAVRTSMNLNMNPRFENFEISDDPAFCQFLLSVADEIFETQLPENQFSKTQAYQRSVWERSLQAVEPPETADANIVADLFVTENDQP